MADTYSTRGRYIKQEIGANDDTWGTKLNANLIDIVDQAVHGYDTIALADSNYSLTVNNGSVDEARNRVLVFSGSLTDTRTITLPDVEDWHIVENQTGQSLTFSNSASSSTVTVAAGQVAIIYTDGTDVFRCTPELTGAIDAGDAVWSDLGRVTVVDINGGSIDGVNIGSVTPSTATFTQLTVNSGAGANAVITETGLNRNDSVDTIFDFQNTGAGTFDLRVNGASVLTTLDAGSGNGLEADTVDGIDGGSLLRSDASDNFTSGTLTFNGGTTLDVSAATVTFADDQIPGSKVSATGLDASTLGGVAIGSVLRSDAADSKTSGDLTFNDNVSAVFGTGGDWKCYHDGLNNYMDLAVGDLFIRNGVTTQFTFARTTGNFTAEGDVTAFSDMRKKKEIRTIENALEKVKAMRGVTFRRRSNDTHGMGVIAQEVIDYAPEVVGTDSEGYYTVAYGNLVGLLIEAIKDLEAEVAELKARV